MVFYRNKHGFTIPELLVYLAIFAIIAGVITGFIIWVYNANTKYQAMQETTENLRRAMELMVYEINEAKMVYSSTTNSNQLSLQTFHYLPDQENTSFIDFFLCGNRLCLKKEGFFPVHLTSDRVIIDRLVFSKISATSTMPSIQIALSLSYKNPHNLSQYTATASATTTASLRVY